MPQAFFIGAHSGGKARIACVHEINPLLLRPNMNHFSDLLQKFGQMHVGQREFHESGFDFGQVENFVNQIQQVRPAVFDDVEAVYLPFRQVRGVFQDLRVA